MQFQTIGNRIKALRLEQGLDQRELARMAGLSSARLCEFERGARSPGSEALASIAYALGVDVETLARNTDWLAEEQRARLRSLSSQVVREFSRESSYRPPCDRDMSTQLRKAYAKYPERVRALLDRIRTREDEVMQLRMLSTVVAGSSLEAVVHLALLVLGLLVLVAPEALGFRKHPVVNPKTREGVGDRTVPAYRVTLSGRPCILIPQVSLACRKHAWTVDFLGAIIDSRGHVTWFYIEIDGEGHDRQSDRIKEEDIDLPMIRLDERTILDDNLLLELESRIAGLIRLAS
jgi:transcriptional regulator with XRE-family HTH domain